MEQNISIPSENTQGFFSKMTKYLKNHIGQIFLHFAVLVLLFFVLYPMILLIMKSFKTYTQEQLDPFGFPSPLVFENYSFAWLNINSFFINSVILTVTITAMLITISSITAFAFVKFDFPFKETLFVAMLALMMIPGMLTLISQYAMVNAFDIVDNYWGVILPSVAGSIPFSVFLLRTFFRGISRGFFEAAEIDGAGNMRIFLTIMIPLSRAIIATLVITTFIGAWNDYLWPLLVLQSHAKKTIPVGLVDWSRAYYQMTGGWGPPFAAYIISSLPLIIVFSISSKQFIQGLTSGAFKM